MSTSLAAQEYEYERVVAEIYDLNWSHLREDEMVSVAWAYCFFSVQFRENLQLACTFYPQDLNLKKLEAEECHTDNLSPYPGVADVGEKLNHDEFMRRLLCLSPISEKRQSQLEKIGNRYLQEIRATDPETRALSISSYEDGGLETVFKGILKAHAYQHPVIDAFRFFITEHIRFDSDPVKGHGALSRHMVADDRILPLWVAFKALLVEAIPGLLAAC
jgi:hypothetical protein